jgi:lysophospholipase L1-like esterase
MTNKYLGKLFSILGDSISTLSGYSEPFYAAFYDNTQKIRSGVLTTDETWWGHVINQLKGQLLINNSFSGSTVTKLSGYMVPSYACSNERTSALGYPDLSPDIIMVFIGINDWGLNVKLLPSSDSEKNDTSVFYVAYNSMLDKLQKNYPNSEIWCLTLPISTCTRIDGFTFPYFRCGRHINEYNDIIRLSSNEKGCKLIELYDNNVNYDTIDGFHPNADGMKTIANRIIREIDKEE